MAAGDEKDPLIFGMSYNSTRDELFLADRNNGVVRAMQALSGSQYCLPPANLLMMISY